MVRNFSGCSAVSVSAPVTAISATGHRWSSSPSPVPCVAGRSSPVGSSDRRGGGGAIRPNAQFGGVTPDQARPRSELVEHREQGRYFRNRALPECPPEPSPFRFIAQQHRLRTVHAFGDVTHPPCRRETSCPPPYPGGASASPGRFRREPGTASSRRLGPRLRGPIAATARRVRAEAGTAAVRRAIAPAMTHFLCGQAQCQRATRRTRRPRTRTVRAVRRWARRSRQRSMSQLVARLLLGPAQVIRGRRHHAGRPRSPQCPPPSCALLPLLSTPLSRSLC